MDEEIDIHEVMDAVRSSLDGARVFHLEVEVMAYALKYLKENPSLSISQAIGCGYFEWVK